MLANALEQQHDQVTQSVVICARFSSKLVLCLYQLLLMEVISDQHRRGCLHVNVAAYMMA
eukprot:6236504-Amphidinium_carterae.2